jgi:hypothetical protein
MDFIKYYHISTSYQVVIIDSTLVCTDSDLSNVLALPVVDANVVIRNAITPQTSNILLYQHYPWNKKQYCKAILS